MPTIEITRTETKSINLESLTPEAVAAIHATGFRIEAVDDKEVVGFCEICGMPLFEEDSYASDEDGIMWHETCDDGTGE